jgi:hypothetical protein
MNPKELEIPAKKPCILAPPKEVDVKKIYLGIGDPEKTAVVELPELYGSHVLTIAF